MPKVRSRTSRQARSHPVEAYHTWTVPRLHRELQEQYDIAPELWLKKSGLVSLLKSAAKEDPSTASPAIRVRTTSRSRRATASHLEYESTVGPVTHPASPDVPSSHSTDKESDTIASMAATLKKLESTVAMLVADKQAQRNDVTRDSPPLQQLPQQPRRHTEFPHSNAATE